MNDRQSLPTVVSIVVVSIVELSPLRVGEVEHLSAFSFFLAAQTTKLYNFEFLGELFQ